jgi:V/A-type H+-transporting ATPase subunit I
MIVPMKKVSILVMDKEKDSAMQEIRELGILHVGRRAVHSPDLTHAVDRRIQIEIAIGELGAFKPLKKGRNKELPQFEGDLVSHVVQLADRRKKLLGYIFHHQRERENFVKWGNFSPADFEYLLENGVNVNLYELSFASYEEDVGDVPVIVLDRNKKTKIMRLIAFDEIPNLIPAVIPHRSLSDMENRDRIRREELGKIETELRSLAHLKKSLNVEKESALMEIDFETARACMTLIDEDAEDDGETTSKNVSDFAVSWISGYVPTPDIESLKKAATKNGWALCADDPAEDDTEVPTKLKNNRLVSFVYPLTNFLGVTPGYHEMDVSSLFLIFFSLFCGMLFGDAGYGAVIVFAAIIGIALTVKKGVPLFFKFLFLMGASTVVWGALTCAWFGIEIALLPRFLQDISLPLITSASAEPGWLSLYNESNFWIQSGLITVNEGDAGKAVNIHLMVFCFSVALLHLGIARIKKMLNIKSLKALAELGQIGMLVGMYFLVLSLVVFKTGFNGIETWHMCSILGGIGLVFVFENYEGSILKSILTSCANIISVVLSIPSVFSDVMSYIRLWAVGMAGAALSETVNGFVSAIPGDFVFLIFAGMLFVIGHGFNMVLCVLGVLVHGVRLNTLEFSTNVGLGWTGFKYRPVSPNIYKTKV